MKSEFNTQQRKWGSQALKVEIDLFSKFGQYCVVFFILSKNGM